MADETAILNTTPVVAEPTGTTVPSAGDTVSTGRAESYAERLAAARADIETLGEDPREATDKGGTPERAPESRSDATALPPGQEHSPDEKDGERPAAKAQAPDVAANNARRAQRDPAQNPDARERQLEAALRQSQEEATRLDFDNRILWNASGEAKRIARETGAVAYSELDDATRTAIQNQNTLRAQAQQAQYQEQVRQQQFAGIWQQEVVSRNEYGKASRADAIADVLAAAAEAGLRVSKAKVEEHFKEGYSDPLVLADIELWQSHMTPGELARSRIDVAMKRNAERVIGKLTTAAIDELRAEHREVPRYERTQAYGGASNAPPVARSARDIPYAQRKAEALADWSDSITDDVRRLTG